MTNPLDDTSSEAYFLPFQRRWLSDTTQIKFWEKSRRIGATYCQAWEDVRDLIQNEETGLLSQPKVWFSSADQTAAKEYIDYCAHWCSLLNVASEAMGEKVIDEDRDVKALVLEIPGVGVINALSSNPSQFRSKGGKAILDEFAIHKNQGAMWDAAHPLTTWGDPMRVMSTHLGKRLFYQMIEKAKAGRMGGSVHTVTILDAVEEGLLDKIKGRPTTEEERTAWLQQKREECRDEEQWLQEYMCTPVDAADAFLTYDMIAACEDGGVLWTGGVKEHYSTDADLYLGFDIGRRKDLSVIWVVEKIGPMLFTRSVRVLEKMPFRAQREILDTYMQHPRMRRACIDETGIGMQLAEDAVRDYGRFRVEPVTFTNSWKEEAAYELRRRVEEKTIVLPQSQDVRDDLHSVKKSVTGAGNIRFDVAGGDGHADRFWAGALACHAVSDYTGPAQASSRRVRPRSGIPGMDRFAGGVDTSGF